MLEIVEKNITSRIKNSDFEMIRHLVYERSGINLTPEKKLMVEARLRKRVKELKLENIDRYFEHLNSQLDNEEEIISLLNVISTNKTDFFRESEHFQYLKDNILHKYIASDSYKSGNPFKIWCAASSTGEEPYTISFVLKEFQENETFFNFELYASDISTKVLEKAYLGIYEEEKAKDIPYELRQKYLLKSKNRKSGLVRVKPEIRKLVKYFRLNLKDDEYKVPQNFDVIFCRNVLIYFDKKMQEEVIISLSNHLKSGGYLITGHAETLSGMNLPLKRITSTIYQKGIYE